MLNIRLNDTALISCSLESRFSGEEDDVPDTERSTYDPNVGYPDEQLIQLRIQSTRDEREVVAWIEGKIDDERMPFRLSFEMAFLYLVAEGEQVPASEEVEPTLIWIAFPYMRELVADLTGRSPSPQYFLPPLTRLPEPEVPAGTD